MEIRFDNPKTIFLVTGAFGHLGNVVVTYLLERGARVRALIHPRDLSDERFHLPIELVRGDLRSIESIKSAFVHEAHEELIVIHTASLISTMVGGYRRLYHTNVVGTKNLLDLSVNHGVKRFLYVSSVHALTELPLGLAQTERTDFNPKNVMGSYAKSKAVASRLVLSYARKLDVVIVHPSGIIGPADYTYSQTNQVFYDFLRGKLPAIIKGGYDFVDVRDVALGMLGALIKGQRGQTYLLTGKYVSIAAMIGILAKQTGRKMPKTLALWVAKMVAPFVEAWAKMWHKRPLFTPYSLYTTGANGLFDHSKATLEFGYTVRPLDETINDITQWYHDVVMAPKRLRYNRKKYL